MLLNRSIILQISEKSFGIIEANSDLPFNTRTDILFKRLRESNNTTSANSELFNQAFSRVFANSVFRSVPPKVIGNRLTPSSWNPNTIDEWINCERNTLISEWAQWKIDYINYTCAIVWTKEPSWIKD